MELAETADARHRSVLAVFLDGLGADAVSLMPFLSSQPTISRLRTELGYSVTCHASMYTGVRPDRHHLWFIWQRDATRSPFRWLRPFRVFGAVDNLPMRVAATKVTRRMVRTTSWFGIPYPVHVPWRYLPELDIAERKLWSDPAYLATAPTIFDRLRAAGVGTEIVGMAKGRAEGIAAIENWNPPGTPASLTYLFAGDIDHASHAHGQQSSEVASLLRRVDGLVQETYAAMQRRVGDIDLVVWSDHGHHDVQRLDPFDLVARQGLDIRRYLHVIDTNFIRVWVADSHERREVAKRLDETAVGHVLTDDELERHRVRMPDDRYGDLIYYLDLPYAFGRTIWGFGRRLASGHGYLPDYPGSDGIFVSSVAAREGPMHLVDVAPSLLDRLGVGYEAGLDGTSVWVPAQAG